MLRLILRFLIHLDLVVPTEQLLLSAFRDPCLNQTRIIQAAGERCCLEIELILLFVTLMLLPVPGMNRNQAENFQNTVFKYAR